MTTGSVQLHAEPVLTMNKTRHEDAAATKSSDADSSTQSPKFLPEKTDE